MKFDDPVVLDCPGCAEPVSLPLNDVVSLVAACPACAHSFREFGIAMRRHANQMTRSFVVWEVVWIFEGRYGFTTKDDEVDRVRTPADLIELLRAKSDGAVAGEDVLAELAGRIRRPLDATHLHNQIEALVPDPTS